MPKSVRTCTAAYLAACLVALSGLRAGTVEAGAKLAAPAVLPVPANYRQWVYLTSGLDMTYTQPDTAPLPPDHKSEFDNVFVNPEAYRIFVRTATWPDNTVFVLENRVGERNVSINRAGRTQGAEITGIELHAKLNNEWVFYARVDDGTEHLIPKPAGCYTCHAEHAAVDTTFTHVLSSNYLAEQRAAGTK